MKRRGGRRILFAVGSLAVGGTESQVVMLVDGLVARGWTVSVLALEKSGALIAKLEQAGVRVLDGGYRASARPWLKVLLLALCEIRLFRHALIDRPDVIHSFLPLSNFMSALAGRLAFVPLVITSRRGLGRHQERYPPSRWLDRIANALSDVVTANSQAVALDTQIRDGYDISRIVVIPNGLDFSHIAAAGDHRDQTRSELGLSTSDIAIVMVANLIPYKGHPELIEAFARVAAGDSRLKLLLIGEDRGIMQNLIDDARRHGVVERINLMGQRADVPRLLGAMDIGVLASHEEGFSNALLEKLVAGLPVVATSVGGTPEALEGMPDCFLVKPHDAEDLARGLKAAIGRLGADDANRNIRQQRVRERYSVGAMVDAYERLYEQRRS